MYRKISLFKIIVACLALAISASACNAGATDSQQTVPGQQTSGSANVSSATLSATQVGPAAAGGQATQNASLPVTGQQADQAAAAGSKLNLNTATAEDFLTIPNLGSRMVREFQEYRPYTSILQFRKEIGKYVSADQVAAYEQYVFVPISANESDAATLQQIPGLDASEVEALTGARPFASNDAFLAALAQYVSASDLAAARAYLSGQ